MRFALSALSFAFAGHKPDIGIAITNPGSLNALLKGASRQSKPAHGSFYLSHVDLYS
jgi:hypothetical protein